MKHEIQYENGCKLEFKGFGKEELQGLTPPFVFVDEMISPKYKELEETYLKFLDSKENE